MWLLSGVRGRVEALPYLHIHEVYCIENALSNPDVEYWLEPIGARSEHHAKAKLTALLKRAKEKGLFP